MGFRKNREKETVKANNGLLMTIVKYYNCRNMTVEFEGGIRVENVEYSHFKRGQVGYPGKNTIRLRNSLQRTGELSDDKELVIKEYDSAHNIIVSKTDNSLETQNTYHNFKGNNITDRVKRPYRVKSDRVGEVSTASNGMKMKIIAYRGCEDIDIEFEDKVRKYGVRYDKFLEGKVAYPKETILK